MSEGKFTFIDFAAQVLKNSGEPMTAVQIWEAGKDIRQRVGAKGARPWGTLAARICENIKKPDARFIRVGDGRPARFALKEEEGGFRQTGVFEQVKQEFAKTKTRGKTYNWSESDIHPLVCHFLRKNPVFAGGKKVIAKTIDHTKSRSARSRAPDQWAHPDMVGFHMPFGQNRAHENWKDSVAQLNQITDNNALRLYSFELKRKIDRGSYRQSFFQAVSNSSWAHEGYLVAADIHSDAEFRSELGRLSASFGIGIILLDLNDFEDNSKVLFPATQKEILDWEAINKLSMLNPDFNEFIKDVMVSFKEKRILGKFDQLIEEPAKYIKKHKMA